MSLSEKKSEFEVDDTHRVLTTQQLAMPPRVLLGPGPSNAAPRVLAAIGQRQVGHLDPSFLKIMDETQELMRYAFQTKNKITIPVSGTGSAAMESTFANLIERGDKVLIGVAGYFGVRMVDMANRYGAQVVQLNKPWGSYWTRDELAAALKEHKPKVLALVHADTSTGVSQPLEGVGQLCHDHGALLLVDAVTSLGGMPLFVDDWGIDACYSGSQKCLSCPPGIAPVTFSQRAMDVVMSRKTPVANWYLDMTAVAKYWGGARTYHHTAPINMVYAMREALRLVAEEGLAERWRRHQRTAEMFWNGLRQLGIKLFVEDDARRLPSLTAVCIPDGVDGKAVTKYMLAHYNLEIGGGLGELGGKVWRVGLMGFNSRPENVALALVALQDAIRSTTRIDSSSGKNSDALASVMDRGVRFHAASDPVSLSNMFSALPGSLTESLRDENLNAVWQHYDADGSGYLDLPEIHVLVKHIFSQWQKEMEGHSASDDDDSAYGSSFIQAVKLYLQDEQSIKSVARDVIFECDADRDSRVSREEFVTSFAAAMTRNLELVTNMMRFHLAL